MIKNIITDLAYDNIKLSQALTRSKLLAARVNNDSFKQWLNKELEGYQFEDKFLPYYRRIKCQMYITHSLPTGVKQSKPLVASEEAGREFYEEVNYHRFLEPVAVLEKHVADFKGLSHVVLTTDEAYHFSQGDKYQSWVIGGYREFGVGQLQNIIELTKQKLLDTLLELDREFPLLTDEFKNNTDNMEKVQNIITNNIYGDHNSTNIAAGQLIEQKDIFTTLNDNDYAVLEKLGVDRRDVEELKQIIVSEGKEKPALKQKALK